MSEKFEPVKYGKEYKKITFYDSDKRHADLRIRLQYDGMKANKKQKEVKSKFALNEGEIDSIFDLLEGEHSEL